MSTKDKTKKKNKKSSGAKATAEVKQEAASNPRLVAAIRVGDQKLSEAKSSLINIATICQEEQLTRGEVVASMMEARGIEKVTADSQYSRMKKLLTDPEVLNALKSGEIDLRTARTATTTKQKNPSPAKKKENIQKRFNTALKNLIAAAKEGGMDRASLLTTVKSESKKAGIV